MLKNSYIKSALTYTDQLQQLKDRGLIIDNYANALFLLENISYYRLSGYWYPLLNEPKSNHVFKSNSSFDLGFNIYCFDRELRKLVTAELEKIEVAIKSKMIYVLSHSFGPFWYNDVTLFRDPIKFSVNLEKLKEEFKKSDEQFLVAFKNSYNDPLPPSWMILEILSFGGLLHSYKNLKPGKSKREISKYFGLDDRTFESWLHSLTYIRNVCAHHSRLWNRVMRIAPSILINPTNKWLLNSTFSNSINKTSGAINNRTYYLLSMILYFLETIHPKHSFKQKLISLLDNYPNIDPLAMGFIPEWKNEPLWKSN